MLDFDMQRQCSITLSTLNVYACLTCGKYLQGKGPGTNAYMHSLQQSGHSLFIALENAKVYCLPENVECVDK